MTNTNNLPWSFLDSYRGKVFDGEWPTFPQVFRISAERFPDSPCFTDFDGPNASKRSFSYAQALKDSEQNGALDWAGILRLAQAAKGADPYGERAGLIALIEQAQKLSAGK